MKKITTKLVLILLVNILVISCSPTKYVPEGKYIVDKVKVKTDSKSISVSKFYKITQTRGLKKILGIFPLRAMVYNIPNPKNEKKIQRKKQERIQKKNTRKDQKFEKDLAKLRLKNNKYFNKVKRLQKSGDSATYRKALKKYKEIHEKFVFLSVHAPELKAAKHVNDVFTMYDFLHKIGQQPQIFDPFFVDLTLKQYNILLKNKGYFKAKTQVKIDTIGKKRLKITYIIEPGPPLTIGSVAYNFPKNDELIQLFNSQNLRIKVGDIINIDELETFRTKISNFYRNKGYYYFSPQLINFKIDTLKKYSNASLIVEFKKDVNPKIYQKWYIHHIFIFNDYNPNLALANKKMYLKNIDTNIYIADNKKYYILKKNEIVIKPKYIVKEIYINPDSLYSLNSTQQTYSHLSKFRIYKLTNIQFSEDTTNRDTNFLNCNISLSPSNLTDITYEIEATNTSLSNGGAANITFTHKNLFHGGEILDFKLELALQKQRTFDSTMTDLFNTKEYNFDMKITFPRLLIPFKSSKFIRQNNPTTIIQTSYSLQDRPEYNKIEALLNLDYRMKSSPFSTFIITPLRFSSIRVLYIAPDFRNWLLQSNLIKSYDDYFIFGTRFTYTYSNQGKPGNTLFFQTNFSTSGNILYALMKKFGKPTYNGVYDFPLFNTPFSQFTKLDFDIRYYIHGINDQTLIFRLFTGAGIPYGNSSLMPFGEKYFVGGANSIRGWQARTLGPGAVQPPEGYKYINQSGDIKLEANIEYRFPIISILEGALFMDMGNIWDFTPYEDTDANVFYINKFYKQIAYSTGAGIRLNLNYIVVRLDLGLKLADPALPAGYRFIPFARPYSWQDLNINIAIGYPF